VWAPPPTTPSSGYKRATPRWQNPHFPSPFPLQPRAPAAIACRPLAEALAIDLLILSSQRTSMSSRCFYPCFCSSSPPPPASTLDHAAADRHSSESSSLSASTIETSPACFHRHCTLSRWGPLHILIPNVWSLKEVAAWYHLSLRGDKSLPNQLRHLLNTLVHGVEGRSSRRRFNTKPIVAALLTLVFLLALA
jgi:hypothetical protein